MVCRQRPVCVVFCLTLLWCFVATACGLIGPRSGQTTLRNGNHFKTIVVMPFATFKPDGGLTGALRCPICGTVCQGGEIEAGAEAYLTKQLMAYLKKNTTLTLIPPYRAQEIRYGLLSGDVSLTERRLMVDTGKAANADAVLGGIIFRFRQRQGRSLSVERPASVGFGLHLISVGDNRLVWARHFDETQKSLSENLFALRTFVNRGGRWLSAEELSLYGLKEMLKDFPVP